MGKPRNIDRSTGIPVFTRLDADKIRDAVCYGKCIKSNGQYNTTKKFAYDHSFKLNEKIGDVYKCPDCGSRVSWWHEKNSCSAQSYDTLKNYDKQL